MSTGSEGSDINKKAYQESFSDGPVVIEKADEVESGRLGGFYSNLMSMFHGETRGIERVPEEEKTQTSIYTAGTMWLSANMVIATFSLGALSYSVFGLDFGTSVLVIFFFSVLGALPVAFFSVFGAKLD